jgi:hypothetical protein
MEALGSWKVCMWGHLSARGRTANAFLCFGTVSPDSAFRLHVSPHIALVGGSCAASRWRCERVVVCY